MTRRAAARTPPFTVIPPLDGRVCMPVLIYARVSTEEQARSGFSLTEQLRACRARAAAVAPGAGALEFSDDLSGELLDRPGLQGALAIVRQAPGGWFICLDPDRLARRLMHQLLVTDEIERCGWRLEFVQHDYQETAEGRLFYQLRGAIAEFEKAKILERTARGRSGKVAAGGLPHAIRMYGYRFVKGAGKRAPARESLVPEPREAAWVRQIYRWFAGEGLSPAAIAVRLNALGVPTKTGCGVWRAIQVRRILSHPAYATGRLQLGKADYRGAGVARRLSRAQRAEQGVRLSGRPRPPEQWREVLIEPIVPAELWRPAAAARPAPRAGRETGAPRLLSGLGYCGLCGSRLHYLNGSKLACSARHRGEPCRLPAKPRLAVEDAVWAVVRSWLLDESLLALASCDEPVDESEPLKRELARCQAEVERLGMLYARGLWPAELALPALEGARRQAALLEERLGGAPARAHDRVAAADAAATLDSTTAHQRAQLIRLAVDRVVMHPSGRGAAPVVTVVPRDAPPGWSSAKG